MYHKRTLERFLRRAAEQFPVLLITGARQVGKTSIFAHLREEGRTYLTLDDPSLALLAKEEPSLFLQRFPPPVIIDEIQYAPELLPHIKMYVDREKKPGAFWLTGSQQFQLMQGVSESLAGRVGIVRLLGLSLRELQDRAESCTPFLPTRENLFDRFSQTIPLSLPQLYTYIWRGSFPAIALHEQGDKELFYSSYVQTYLQRDVRHLAKVGDEHSFLKFLQAAAARTGQLLNLSDLARDVGISPVTAKSWLSILETSGIVYLLEPYFSNITKRLVKAPKLYFLDTGLASYLTGWSSPETLEAGAMSGAILETFAVIEVLKTYLHNGKSAPIYYYRDKDKKEIDLLIIKDNAGYPLECKKTASPSKDDIRHFHLLEKLP
ncbi:MAG: ATP-binding protein, partial [Chlamydiae bacterium]|nr:ATP-binding protein [Chlamydiota bacterium]